MNLLQREVASEMPLVNVSPRTPGVQGGDGTLAVGFLIETGLHNS
jgi:hypothetical protein